MLVFTPCVDSVTSQFYNTFNSPDSSFSIDFLNYIISQTGNKSQLLGKSNSLKINAVANQFKCSHFAIVFMGIYLSISMILHLGANNTNMYQLNRITVSCTLKMCLLNILNTSCMCITRLVQYLITVKLKDSSKDKKQN
jgi:hypothetical protein